MDKVDNQPIECMVCASCTFKGEKRQEERKIDRSEGEAGGRTGKTSGLLLETGTDCIDNACRVPWRGDCAIVLYWGDVWLCDGKLAGTFSVYLCGVRNDSSILWSNELSDHIDSDRI